MQFKKSLGFKMYYEGSNDATESGFGVDPLLYNVESAHMALYVGNTSLKPDEQRLTQFLYFSTGMSFDVS